MEGVNRESLGCDDQDVVETAQVIRAALSEHVAVMASISESADELSAASAELVACVAGGSKILVCGNGGSAADAQHLAAELVGRFLRERRPLPAIALTVNTSVLTAVANDYQFADVFRRQVEALGHPGDVLVAISTSGDSPNVLRAAECARSKGMKCIGILGHDGGRLAPLCDVALIVRASHVARIQEAHEWIIHVLCELVENSIATPE